MPSSAEEVESCLEIACLQRYLKSFFFTLRFKLVLFIQLNYCKPFSNNRRDKLLVSTKPATASTTDRA